MELNCKNIQIEDQQFIEFLNELTKQSHESEWVKFKQNFHSCEEIGERISALSNGACINEPLFDDYLIKTKFPEKK